MEMFQKYCLNPLDVPVITRGEGETVCVGFKGRNEAIRALQTVGQQNEDFPELEVAPASRV